MSVRLLTVCICLLALISCKKESIIHVSGKNPVNGVGYQGLNFAVIARTNGMFEAHYKTVYRGELDENGEHVFNLKLKNNKSYRLVIDQPKSNCYYSDLTYVLKHDSAVMHANFEFADCAYLKFRYHNISCFNNFDHIKVERRSQFPDFSGFEIPAEYSGCNDFTMPNFVEVPMGWWFFNWEVTKNGNTEYFEDSLYLQEGEQKYYEFNY